MILNCYCLKHTQHAFVRGSGACPHKVFEHLRTFLCQLWLLLLILLTFDNWCDIDIMID